MSASSNTINGALPPSSIDVRFTVPAHCSMSSLPTAVEPVNVSLRTIGLPVISAPISRVMPPSMLITPARHAGTLREFGCRERGQRGFVRGLAHDRAAGGERRSDLARHHRIGEIPRRDTRDDTDGLFDHDDAFVVGGLRESYRRRRVSPPRRTTRCSWHRRRSRREPRQAACPARRSGSVRGPPGARASARTTCAGWPARSLAVVWRHSICARSAASIARRVSSAVPHFAISAIVLAGRGVYDGQRFAAVRITPGAIDVRLGLSGEPGPRSAYRCFLSCKLAG